MQEYMFCPFCRKDLVLDAQGYLTCPPYKFIHWDDPKPTVSCVVPMEHA